MWSLTRTTRYISLHHLATADPPAAAAAAAAAEAEAAAAAEKNGRAKLTAQGLAIAQQARDRLLRNTIEHVLLAKTAPKWSFYS